MYKPQPAGPKSIRELFHYLWKELSSIGRLIGDDTGSPGSHTHPHNTLLNITPNDHHNQVHDFFGSDHSNIPDHALPFPDKPKGEAVFLIITGQSNALGAGTNPPLTGPTTNSNVFDWTTGGSGSVYSFQVPDLSDPERPDFEGNATPYVGLPLGGRGNIGWAAANRIQLLTGLPVYMVCAGKNATAISEWLSGGEVNDVLTAQVPAALSAAGLSKVDFVCWMQGETDLLDGRTKEEYAADWASFQLDAEGKWATRHYTRWALCEYATQFATFDYQMDLIRFTEFRTDEFVRSITSSGLTTVGDNVHFDPMSLNEMGDRCADTFLSPASGKDKATVSHWLYGPNHTDVDLTNTPVPGTALIWDGAKWGAYNAFVSAGYGKLVNTTAKSITLSATWTTLGDWDVSQITPLYVIVDAFVGSMSLGKQGIWRLGIYVELSFDPLGSSSQRSIEMRLYNLTKAGASSTITAYIGRDMSGCTFVLNTIINVPLANEGDDFVMQLSTQDTFTNVEFINGTYDAFHVSEVKSTVA